MKSKKIFGAIALISLGFLFIAPQIAQAAIGNQGRILYTKDVVRNTDGTIASTGNLFVKDLATNIEQQVTNYSGTFSILNPMFDADGRQIIYTSNVAVGSDTTYKIYLVSADASINEGVGIELQGGVGDINYKYAALSPDGNTIVFSYEDSDGMSLWAYDRKTHIYQQVYSDPVNGIDIRDVVFVNNTTIAFIGKSQGIQNIYKTDLTGPTTIKITNNKDGGCGYLGLKSGVRSALAGDVLIYSKRTKYGSTWSPFDVYVTLSLDPFIETAVTATIMSGQDEYEACFYGDDSATRDVQLTSTNGNMFYIARIIGSKNKVWQANFDTAGGSTNTGKTQRTVDDDVAGQVDWAPPITEQAPTIGVDSTEIAFIGTDAQVKVGDFTDATTIDPIVTVTTPGTVIMGNPSLGAARIVYDVKTGVEVQPSYIKKMNSDGTNNDVFIDESTPGFTGKKVIRMPSISPDGKWVFFVAGTPTGNKQIYAKGINKSLGGSAVAFDIGSNAEDPVVSPDMSSLVWVENNGGMRTIYRISLSCDAANDTAVVMGTAQILGGNISELWSDKNPSFSPDGTKIIFVSNRDGSDKIYTMDAGTGLGVNLFPGLPGITNPAYPQYSPLNDGSIVFVADGPVVGQRVLYSSSGPILDSTGANIVVTGDKFSWNIERNPGDIIATRTLQSRASAGAELTYKIKIDVDEGKTPVSYTLNEVIPNWTVINVWRDDTKLDSTTTPCYYILSDTPVTGLKTLKFVFSAIPGGSAGTVADHILTISVTAAGTGTKSFSGTISYFMNDQAQSALVSGNGTLNILNPYCPVDKYNVKKEANKSDGIIQDLDLLYGIEAWSSSAQLPGYGTGWPAYSQTNWDNIILAVINIWASPAGTQGHHSAGQVTDGSTVAGEYQYVGPNLYKPSAVGTEVQEMYWTQGMWSD